MNDIINALPEMKSGNELISALSVLPYYNENIRSQSNTARLIALSDLYDIFIPNSMSIEIYSKLYLALLRSLQKKLGITATRQQNENHKAIRQMSYNGIIGGSSSFTITGNAGLGKSAAINRSIEIITAHGVIEVKNPHTKIIPCVIVQTPFDCSVKGLLLEILRKVDEYIGSDYYTKSSKIKVTTDMLIGCVSQVALNHIGLLIVDEIQNVVTNKHGTSLIGLLTQLINNSGISICMVGTPESETFFEKAVYLARRSLGLRYGALEYNQYFYDFCKTVWSYQYVRNKSEITDAIVNWLYQHSGGIISTVISLIHDAQEIAILNGKEILNIDTLTEAYKKRLTMLHGFIEPSIERKSQTATRKATKTTYQTITDSATAETNLIASLVARSKAESIDILSLLKEHITVEVVKI